MIRETIAGVAIPDGRVSGTIVISYDADTGPPVDQHDRGRERFKYALTVTRVR